MSGQSTTAKPATMSTGGDIGGGDPTQQAAKLAAALIPKAIEVVDSILEKPTRGSASQLGAARLIFELSANLKPEERATAAVVKLVDAKAAAEELQRRLQSK
jgi:hypothetical protein